MSIKFGWIIGSFMKIAAVKCVIYLGSSMDFYRYFSHLISYLGEIWYNTYTHNAVGHFWVSWKSRCTHKQNYFFRVNFVVLFDFNQKFYEFKNIYITPQSIVSRKSVQNFLTRYRRADRHGEGHKLVSQLFVPTVTTTLQVMSMPWPITNFVIIRQCLTFPNRFCLSLTKIKNFVNLPINSRQTQHFITTYPFTATCFGWYENIFRLLLIIKIYVLCL
jgi:hypothetical protein